LIRLATVHITWVKVEKPTFDLVGVVLGSLELSAMLAALALFLGLGFALLLIRRHRGRGAPTAPLVGLGLESPPQPR